MAVHEMVTYSDYRDRQTELTQEQLAWFHSQVELAKMATGYQVEIVAYDHELYAGKSKDALGCCITTDPENQLGADVDTYITIDCYFIDECWRHEFRNDFLIAGEDLLHVIAHELAHLTVWRHGKRHTALTEEIYSQIMAA